MKTTWPLPPAPKQPLELRMFLHAQGFHLIAKRNVKLGEPSTTSAGLVNSAFACELYLKCLIQIESGQTVKLHELDRLFKLLKPETKDQIEKRFNEVAAKDKAEERSKRFFAMTGVNMPWKFRDELAAASTAFVEWRYLYEDEAATLHYGLIPLPDILRAIILEKRPDFQNAGWSKAVEIETSDPNESPLVERKPAPAPAPETA